MDTMWWWIIALVVLALLFLWILPQLRKRSEEARREQAAEVREDAFQQSQVARDKEADASRAAADAREARSEYDDSVREADRLDPDIDTDRDGRRTGDTYATGGAAGGAAVGGAAGSDMAAGEYRDTGSSRFDDRTAVSDRGDAEWSGSDATRQHTDTDAPDVSRGDRGWRDTDADTPDVNRDDPSWRDRLQDEGENLKDKFRKN
ncbi:hypothetical protein N802_13200 [Knoellia sinensis KCTC 19936]|uniref:Uncharacterized protein n=1 Tax=Knoellia sinensis KCTC 19936 TaxID=1385520 RepID=A0A0A0JBW4_9MICO|nr:hypothetical protein [Knoellia sinensis]KGN34304.1 hypothetical protein N802_13200 [Knoellia sinensis KCTC 19936]